MHNCVKHNRFVLKYIDKELKDAIRKLSKKLITKLIIKHKILEFIKMSCNICLESGTLISPCSCSLKAHEFCIKSWHSNISYGKVIKPGNLCCPQCKAPGRARFMAVFDNDKEVINMLEILNTNKDWTHILCPSCKTLKKYMQESCSVHIDNTYCLVCNDCSPKTYKVCPNCGILIEKEEGCLHITCNCGTHFCWHCLEIHGEDNIYKHLDEKHKNILKEQLRYEDYLYRINYDEDTSLINIPNEYWTKELLLLAIEYNADDFLEIENVSLEFILEAIKINGYVLEYVKEQDRELCIEAVKQVGLALEYVKEQDREICLEAVKQDGHALKYVKEQDREICLEAVKQDGHALKYVKEQDREICLEAVKQDGRALQYVEEQDHKICLQAVKQDGRALEYVEEQDHKICLQAVKTHGCALKYVNNQNKEICLEAVKQNGSALRYVKEQNIKICLEAVKQYGLALQYVKKQDNELCTVAVKQNKYALQYVEEQDRNMFRSSKI